ncbi:Hsp20/alpha crystallin family protein [Pontibacter anaerobius]|uniref:Hsp20/alpha crystallin family protein n=1 Tax=Pontibacter anaerobius TaxID=2993940 RepID=A0ABT3RHB9_9BACT|nr:Hsp20/alpha crystallin family protein [Pontibacter anaerobius]MCX2740650.1 Hsp20/alpha crystallin family protein [Pontibacter anaerobius]
MKLIKDKEFLKNIAHQINLLNTIGGGVSETYVDIKKYKKGAVINVWAAGVSPEAFKVVLHNNQLTLFSVLQSEDNPEMAAPLFNRIFLLPPQVDLSRIEALHEDGQLKVKLPYFEGTNQPREIEIKQL